MKRGSVVKQYLILFLGGFSLYWSGLYTAPSKTSSSEKIFTNIYDNAVWGKNSQGYGTSGGGSTKVAAEPYREFLENFIKNNTIKSVVDIGCGDWEFSQHIDWSTVSYTGYDVVEKVISRNQAKYARPNIKFVLGNALTLDLPPADLLLCKDILQHWSTKEIAIFLRKIEQYKYCLITNSIRGTNLNTDIVTGGWRPLIITLPPYSVRGVNIFLYNKNGDTKLVTLICNDQRVGIKHF